MIYPSVIITAMLGIGILMMIMVVPKLTDIFTEMEMDLPLSTRAIIGVSNFLETNYIWSMIILIFFIVLIRLIVRVKEVRKNTT